MKPTSKINSEAISHADEWVTLSQNLLTPRQILDHLTKPNGKSIRIDNILIDCRDSTYSLAEICYKKVLFGRSKKDYMKIKLPLLKRRIDISKSLLSLVAYHANKGHSNQTITNSISNSFVFIKSISHLSFPKNKQEARKSLKLYIDELRHAVRIYTPRNKKIKQKIIGKSANTARRLQYDAINLLCEHLNCSKYDITFDINLITGSNYHIPKTHPVTDLQFTREFNFYTSLFLELTTIILRNKTLPTKIELENGRTEWVAPLKKWMRNYDTQAEKNNYRCSLFDYENGVFFHPEYLRNELGFLSPRHSIKKSIGQSIMTNNIEYSYVKRNIAQIAMLAYFMHFLIVTGMNDSTAATLVWNNDYKEEKNRQHFKNIKYRSFSKEVNFEMQSEFIKHFKLFLDLRDYLFKHENKKNFKFLFFKYNRKINAPAILPLTRTGNVGNYCRKHLNLRTPFKLSTSRAHRVTKGLWVRKRFGETISSYVLQHSLTTSLKNYSGNDKNVTGDELSIFFDKLNKKILQNDKSKSQVKTNIGGCISIDEPDFSKTTPEIFKQCGKGEGCLFCSNYRLHGDEVDLRKIISLKYIIYESKSNASDQKHFLALYGPVNKRIDTLLKELINQQPEKKSLIKFVHNQVFKYEKLTTYWNNKLELLVDIGAL